MNAALKHAEVTPSPGVKVTIGDVAREARVGVSTVSRVLNDEKVSPLMAERVRQALAATGYVYSPRPWPWLTKRKFRRASGDVGVLFIGAGGNYMGSGDVPCMIHCAERALAVQGRSLVVGNMSGQFSADKFLRRRRLDGVIFIHLGGGEADDWMEHANRLARHVPHVWVNERPSNSTAGVLCRVDAGRAGIVAADFLTGRGHRDVAFVSDGRKDGHALMKTAFTERARKHGMRVAAIRETGAAACEQVAREQVSAVFSPDHGTALRLSEAVTNPAGHRIDTLTCVLEKVLMQDPREGFAVMNLRFGTLIELAIDHLIWRVTRPAKSSESLNLSMEPVLMD